MVEAYGAWGEKKLFDKMHRGIIRSHFEMDEEGKLMEVKLKVKPQTTADLARRLVQL